MMDDTRSVRIDCDSLGRGTIDIDGIEIAGRARGFDLQVRVGETPHLIVYYSCIGACIDADAVLETRPKEWKDTGTAEMGET